MLIQLMAEIKMFCPECGRAEVHEVLSRARGTRVRCTVCGTVRVEPPKKERPPLKVKAIVSEEKASRVCSIEHEACAIGDHHVATCGEEYIAVEVSGIERGLQRVRKARARDITTLWTRKIERVAVRVSVHDGKKTVPVLIEVPGEEPFVVGEVYRKGNRRFRIAIMKLRNGDSLRITGQKAPARTIKRIFAYLL
jgi:uncharacterized Zn finger protein